MFSGLIFMTVDKMTDSFRAALEVVNIIMTLITVCALVRRCRLTPANPRSKRLELSA
jgi:hypothetical protein